MTDFYFNELFFKKSEKLKLEKDLTYKTSLIFSDICKNRPDPARAVQVLEFIFKDMEDGSDWFLDMPQIVDFLI